MKPTLTDFFLTLKQAVMFSPKGTGKCKQLQTLRVSPREYGQELASDNLGATICDKDKPYFWSRLWEQKKFNPNQISWEFPLLFVSELSINTKNAMSNASGRTYSFQVAVLDKYSEDCDKGKCQGCEGRTVNEIFYDTETLLHGVVRYLATVTEATTSAGTSGFWGRGYLDWLTTGGQIGGYTPGMDWGGIMAVENKGAVSYRTSVESLRVYGTAIDLSVTVKGCTEPTFDFSNCPDPVLIAQEAGCNDCG